MNNALERLYNAAVVPVVVLDDAAVRFYSR